MLAQKAEDAACFQHPRLFPYCVFGLKLFSCKLHKIGRNSKRVKFSSIVPLLPSFYAVRSDLMDRHLSTYATLRSQLASDEAARGIQVVVRIPVKYDFPCR